MKKRFMRMSQFPGAIVSWVALSRPVSTRWKEAWRGRTIRIRSCPGNLPWRTSRRLRSAGSCGSGGSARSCFGLSASSCGVDGSFCFINNRFSFSTSEGKREKQPYHSLLSPSVWPSARISNLERFLITVPGECSRYAQENAKDSQNMLKARLPNPDL